MQILGGAAMFLFGGERKGGAIILAGISTRKALKRQR